MKDRWEERDKQKDADVIWQAEYKVGDIHMALQSKGQSSLLCDNHVVLNVILYIKKKQTLFFKKHLVTCLEGDKTKPNVE